MLDRDVVVAKMEERGFVVYATINHTRLQFISEHMYDSKSPKHQDPIINVFVDLKSEEFWCIYNLGHSFTTLNTPPASPVMKDDHFDRIVGQFESQAKWLARLDV